MKNLNFTPSKTKREFHKNYKLHDMAEFYGKNLLVQWGIDFKEFGGDKRFNRVWEKGEDKPDIIISYKNKSALLDWKGKHKKGWIVNKRAIKSYEKWSGKLKLPVLIAFFVFDENKNIIDRRVAFLGKHSYSLSDNKQWDKNETVEFQNELPLFSKSVILKAIF